MRVISGSAKGRRLLAPSDRRVRPTADRIKEALFSIICSYIGSLDGLSVLDIFAGSGSLGIEALSRGARQAVFIDSHPESAALVRKNLTLTGLADKTRVELCDALLATSRLAAAQECFDLIFCDPPYGKALSTALLEQAAAAGLLNKGGLMVIETGTDESLPECSGTLRQIDRRIYGSTALTFYSSCD